MNNENEILNNEKPQTDSSGQFEARVIRFGGDF
jgi:hypothetical protein